MDQAHDVVGYFQRGLESDTAGGKIWHVVEPHRDLAVFHGWAKDQPFTAVVFVEFAGSVTNAHMEQALSWVQTLEAREREVETVWSGE